MLHCFVGTQQKQQLLKQRGQDPPAPGCRTPGGGAIEPSLLRFELFLFYKCNQQHYHGRAQKKGVSMLL